MLKQFLYFFITFLILDQGYTVTTCNDILTQKIETTHFLQRNHTKYFYIVNSSFDEVKSKLWVLYFSLKRVEPTDKNNYRFENALLVNKSPFRGYKVLACENGKLILNNGGIINLDEQEIQVQFLGDNDPISEEDVDNLKQNEELENKSLSINHIIEKYQLNSRHLLNCKNLNLWLSRKWFLNVSGYNYLLIQGANKTNYALKIIKNYLGGESLELISYNSHKGNWSSTNLYYAYCENDSSFYFSREMLTLPFFKFYNGSPLTLQKPLESSKKDAVGYIITQEQYMPEEITPNKDILIDTILIPSTVDKINPLSLKEYASYKSIISKLYSHEYLLFLYKNRDKLDQFLLLKKHHRDGVFYFELYLLRDDKWVLYKDTKYFLQKIDGDSIVVIDDKNNTFNFYFQNIFINLDNEIDKSFTDDSLHYHGQFDENGDKRYEGKPSSQDKATKVKKPQEESIELDQLRR